MEILIKRLAEQAKLPVYSREAGPGMDLYALDEVTIEPKARAVISTGVAMAMPVGYIGSIADVQGMAADEALKVTPRMVDSGYREEVTVVLTNTGDVPRTIAAGEKVAQLLVQEVHHAKLIEAEDLSGRAEDEETD